VKLRQVLPAILVLLSVASFAQSTPGLEAKFQTLHAFAGAPSDGSYPYGPLMFDRSGNLFGTTLEGGSSTDPTCSELGCGTLFELQPKNSKWKESLLYSFTASTGYPGPTGPIVFDSHGNLLGTQGEAGSPCGCGAAYELSRVSGVWTQIVLHTFTGGTTDGAYPDSGLIGDKAGNFYGITVDGGSANSGTFFELSPSGDGGYTYSIVYQFASSNGEDAGGPYGPLSMDSHGNIYGTSESGGLYGYGAVFKLAPSETGWTESVIFNLTDDYGNYPQAYGVVPDDAGNLYGTTTYGGPYAVGTVYELSPQPGFWNRAILYSFTGSDDGAYPYGLVIGPSGTLYGVSSSGGSYSWGNVYQVQSSGGIWTQSVLHQFTDGTDGSRPFANLILDSQGNLYGLATGGGTYGFGTVFEVTP
jgi:uncharacterized repeat protein (TIGR03803 family)